MEEFLIVIDLVMGKTGIKSSSKPSNLCFRGRNGRNRTHRGGLVQRIWMSSRANNSAIETLVLGETAIADVDTALQGLPFGSRTTSTAEPRAPFTKPSGLHMLANIMHGIPGVYRKRPWDGILTPLSCCPKTSS